jgi:hypothetical protein
MARRVLGRGLAVIVAVCALGYVLGSIAHLPLLHGLNTDQQAWAVFALGLIAAILFLLRATRVGEVSRAD